MKKRWLALTLAIIMALAFVAACGDSGTAPPAPATDAPPAATGSPAAPPPDAPPPPAPADRPADFDTRTEIVVGAARPHSGRFQSFEDSGFGVFYQRWVDDVNARGGLYVAEYERQLPIRLIRYDDTSDMATMLMLTDRLMFEDQVDILLPTCSSGFIAAQAEVANANGFFLFSAEGGASEIVKNYQDFPYFFVTNSHSAHQVPALVELFQANNITTAFVVHLNDQHGMEYLDAVNELFPPAGIEILQVMSIAADQPDYTPIIQAAMASGAQAYLQFAYQGQNYPAIETMIALNYNPEFLLFSVGVSREEIIEVFAPNGHEIANGIFSWSVWARDSHPATREFYDNWRRDNPGMILDFWTHLQYDIIFDILEEVIIAVGSLDNTKIAEYLNSGVRFETRVGPMWYENNSVAREAYLGNIGQWQDGEWQLIDGSGKTADPIIPKPPWP